MRRIFSIIGSLFFIAGKCWASTLPPPQLDIIPGNGEAMVYSWLASGYVDLYWSTQPGVKKTNGHKVSHISSTYLLSGLANGTSYYLVETSEDISTGVEGVESPEFTINPKNFAGLPARLDVPVIVPLPNGKLFTMDRSFTLPGTSSELKQPAVYDPSTGLWQIPPSTDIELFNATATLLPNGKVFLFGSPPVFFPTTSHIYDPVSNLWSFTSHPGLWRNNHSATLLPNGQVLLAGGFGNDSPTGLNSAGSVLSTALLYDPISDTWNQTGAMHTARQGHTAMLLNNGKVLVFGGNQTAPTEIYDPGTGLWTISAASSYPGSSSQYASVILPNGSILVIGGMLASGSAANTGFLYDPTQDRWAAIAPMNTPRAGLSASLLSNGKVLISGGYSVMDQALSSTEIYDPGTNTWTSGPDLNQPRANHSAMTLSNGDVLLMGGSRWAPHTEEDFYSVERYSVHSNSWLLSPPPFSSSPLVLISTAVLPAATVGEFYRLASPLCGLSIEGGTGFYDVEILSGLPDGFFFDYLGSICEIEGFPTAAGQFHLSVQVTDTAGSRITQSLSFQVIDPLQPTNVHATVSGTSVTLRWDSVVGATGYDIYGSTTPGQEMTDKTVYVPSTTNNSFLVDRLTGGIPWYFVVTAYVSAWSAPSDEVSALPVSTTYYVDPAGNDSNPGTLTQPFKTLTNARNVLAPGDTLLVKPGTYPETFSGGNYKWSPPTVDHPVTIRAYDPAHRPVIQCSQSQGSVVSIGTPYNILNGFVIDAASLCDYGINDNSHHTTITNCEVKSALLDGIDLGYSTLESGSHSLSNLDVHDNGLGNQPFQNGIYIQSSNNIIQNSRVYSNIDSGIRLDAFNIPASAAPNQNTFVSNVFYGNGHRGIGLSAGSGHKILNSIFYNNVTGISLSNFGEPTTNVSIMNNTVIHNTATGIYLGLGSTAINVSNNIVAYQGDSAVYILSPASPTPMTVANNLFFANTGIPNGGGQTIFDLNLAAAPTNNIFNQNPGFVQYQTDGTGDYHLTSNSSAINKGASVGAPSVDFDGNARPHGNGVDIGAYEFMGADPVNTVLSVSPSSETITYIIGGTPPITQPISITSLNPSSNVAISTSVAGDCSWLNLQSLGLQTPYLAVLQVNSSSLVTPSSVTCTVTFANTASGASVSVPLTLLVQSNMLVTPASVSLAATQVQQFVATDFAMTNSTIVWTYFPPIGDLSVTGRYTAPDVIIATQTITITATNQANPSDTGSAVITLRPIQITVTPSTVTLQAGATQFFFANVSNTPNTAVTWAVHPDAGSISTGGKFIAPSCITTAQTVTVTAASNADFSKQKQAIITLAPSCVGLGVTSFVLPTGKAGSFYSTTLQASGGVAPYTWSTSPGLPPGLGMNSQGVISGTPAGPGGVEWFFKVHVVDSASAATDQFLSILIVSSATLTASPSALTFNMTKGSAESSGMPMSLTSQNPSSGVAAVVTQMTGSCDWVAILSVQPASSAYTPLTYNFAANPAGLDVGTYTCNISFGGNADATVSTSTVLTLNVLPATPLQIKTDTLLPAIVGQPYAAALAASGGSGNYQWSLTAGVPPAGILFSTSGVLSGIPTTAGFGTFQVGVTDGIMAAFKVFRIDVSSASSGVITSTGLPPLALNLPSTLPVDAKIEIGLPASSPYVRFKWTFNLASGDSNVISLPAAISAVNSNSDYTADNPHLDLGQLHLSPGLYNVSLTGYDANGQAGPTTTGSVTLVASSLSAVKVHPSPWRSDRGWPEQITFDNIPQGSTVKIFTTSARWVATVNSDTHGAAIWNLKNDSGDAVASGLYIFLVTDSEGNKSHGKFSVIR